MSTDTTKLIVTCPSCSQKNRLAQERLADQPKCGQCKANLIPEQPIDLTLNNYQAHMSSDLPLVVDFWAPWCMPCQHFAPIYAQVAPKFAGRAVFGKINTQNENVLGDRYSIRSIPTIAVFHRGEEITRKAGALPPQELEKWLEQVLPKL